MRSWWARLLKFHPFVLMKLQWHNTEAPWPIISKVRGREGVLPIFGRSRQNFSYLINDMSPKMRWWLAILSEFHLFVCNETTVAWHITPMSIYFKNQRVLANFGRIKYTKNPKRQVLLTIYICNHIRLWWVKILNCILLHALNNSGITQKLHDYL